MQKFSKFIIEHKAIMLSVVIALLVLAVVGVMFVKTNSDIISYLPKDSDTAQGRDILYEKFDIEGDCTLVIKGADKDFIKTLADDIAGRDYISQVAWLGTFDEIKAKLDDPSTAASEKEILQKSYDLAVSKYTTTAKDGSQILKITMYVSAPTSSDEVMGLIDELEEKMIAACDSGKADEFAMGGMAVNSRDMLKSSLGEIPMYLGVAVLILAAILLCTTKSWIEPLIFIATLGISLILNMGSNIIFPEISTITYSASAILQLALAMDYSIFLMHSYYEEKNRGPLITPKEAMLQALPKTLKSVAASALTTIGGFIALFAMQFRMGIDLGGVLAKGVLLSLLTVIIVQPIMILLLSKPIEKTQHRCITPAVKRPQKFATKRYIPIVALAAILIIPTLIGQFKVPLSYITMTKPQMEISETQAIVNSGENQLIFIAPRHAKTANHYKFLSELEGLEHTQEVFSAYSLIPENIFDFAYAFRPEIRAMLDKTFFKEGYALYLVDIDAPVESQECYDTIDKIHAMANTYFGEGKAYVTGLGQGAKDLAAVTPTDFVKVSMISALIILIILLLTYKEVILSLILLFVIELGIWINLSIVTISGISINFMSYLIISSVQLGATVDYAILAASKYKQAKADGETNEREAIRKGIYKASPSILVSALILISVCLAVFGITSNMIVGQITVLIAAGAATSTVLVLFLLPAVLMVKAKVQEKRTSRKLAKAGIVPQPADSGIRALMVEPSAREYEPKLFKWQLARRAKKNGTTIQTDISNNEDNSDTANNKDNNKDNDVDNEKVDKDNDGMDINNTKVDTQEDCDKR